MAEKHYSQDWAKEASREQVKTMIEKHRHSHIGQTLRPYQTMRILCFPGIDAQEVIQVYDALGIQRENIVGVERDNTVADELERKDLGIEVYRGTIDDFVQNEEIDFDVVSLDYIGPMSHDTRMSLLGIIENQQRKNWVYHQANLIRRDQRSKLDYAMGSSAWDSLTNGTISADNQALFTSSISSTVAGINGILDDMEEGNYSQERKGIAYSSSIAGAFTGGSSMDFNALWNWAFKGHEVEAAKVLEGLVKERMPDIKIDPFNPVEPFVFGRLDAEYFIGNPDDVQTKLLIPTTVADMVFGELAGKIKKARLSPVAAGIARAAFSLHSMRRPVFRVQDSNRYSYISESGAPMMGDIYYVEKPVKEEQLAAKMAKMLGYPKGLSLRNSQLTGLIKNMSDYYKIHRKTKSFEVADIDNFENREFLGNSSRPVLTKKRFLAELDKGTAMDKIKETYRGWDKKPLPQWQAHHTMGTYSDESEVATVEPVKEFEEEITKEEVYDLLASGIPYKEVFEAFPTGYKIGQLRAMSAWNTMRSREKVESV